MSLLLLFPALAAAQLAGSPATIPSTATDLQLESIKAAYDSNGFPGADQGTGFGVEIDPEAVMSVVYPGGGEPIQAQGMSMEKDAVAEQPTIYLTPSADSAENFATTAMFTLMLADASSLGSPDPEGNYRHFLANGLMPTEPASAENRTVQLGMGTTITNYAGPGPLPNQGPHRYAWLLFEQPTEFAAPADLSQAGTESGHWSVSSYVQQAHLGDLVAAAFFTVENGQASYSVGPTSAVNPSTLPAATETESADAPDSTGEDSGDSEGADGDSGAGHLFVGAAGTAIMGAAALVALSFGM